jgi:hypothetical protein
MDGQNHTGNPLLSGCGSGRIILSFVTLRRERRSFTDGSSSPKISSGRQWSPSLATTTSGGAWDKR